MVQQRQGMRCFVGFALLSLALAAPLPPAPPLHHRVEHAEPLPTTTTSDGTSSSYSRVQYIGFPIQTGYNGYLGPDNLYMPNDEDSFGVYVGLEDTRADMRGRLEIMQAAIYASLSSQELDHRSDTLKIFMAPEFFFRGPAGAYSVEDPALLELGDRLRKMVGDVQFAHWMFVFGSIIGSSKGGPSSSSSGPHPGPLSDTYNFAVIQRGNSTERHVHFKTYISGIDFLQDVPGREDAIVYANMNLNTPDLNQTLLINGTVIHVPKTKDQITMHYPAFPPKQLSTFNSKMGSSINGSFSMAGLDFCLDLCLDHSFGVCAEVLDRQKAHGGRGEVDVQLIVSAGMSIIPENTRVPMGGSVLLCDGLMSGAQQLIRKFGDAQLGGHVHEASAAEVMQVPRAQLKHHKMLADYSTVAGHLHAANVSVFGEDWRQRVLGLFAAQKYKLKPLSAQAQSSVAPVVELGRDLLMGTPPEDWVFPVTPLAKSSCNAAQKQLCASRPKQACQACSGVHAMELVAAGCEDADIVAFCVS